MLVEAARPLAASCSCSFASKLSTPLLKFVCRGHTEPQRYGHRCVLLLGSGSWVKYCCGKLPAYCDVAFAAQRADEVGKVEPKVAYYCRMYAVEQVGP